MKDIHLFYIPITVSPLSFLPIPSLLFSATPIQSVSTAIIINNFKRDSTFSN